MSREFEMFDQATLVEFFYFRTRLRVIREYQKICYYFYPKFKIDHNKILLE